MGDGVFHLLVVRKPVSRARLLDLFLQIEAGKHIDCDTVRPPPSNEEGEIFMTLQNMCLLSTTSSSRKCGRVENSISFQVQAIPMQHFECTWQGKSKEGVHVMMGYRRWRYSGPRRTGWSP